MDSEQILLKMYKKQQYDVSREKMQKIVMLLSAGASTCATATMILFYNGMLDIFIWAGAVILAGVVILLYRLKVFSLDIACISFMVYICFVLMPLFWYITGIMGSAPYVSIAVLVAILSMFAGKTLKVLLFSYLCLLFALTVFSAIVEIPYTANIPQSIYTLIAYIISILLISSYMLSKQKKFDQLNDHFLRSSFRDELTRLFNRKVLDIIMQYEESIYQENKGDYILIMFDVDEFKKMNDQHGHVYGDIVLRNVAKCINDKVRSSDFVVRYGGDEFLVVQSYATDESLDAFIQRIEEAMDASCYLDIKVSASYGYAARSECESPEEVLALADKRLYEKKEALCSKNTE